MKRKESQAVDLHLAVISATRVKREMWKAMSSKTIASICGCSHQAITQIEQSALKKVRAELYRRKLTIDDFREIFK